MLLPSLNKKYYCDENFFNQDNESSFYWAGFIAADGSVQERKYSKILKICLSNKDLNHLENFKKLIHSTHPIKNYKIKSNKLIKSETLCCEIQITSKLLVNSLKRFNIIPNKTKIYEFPSEIINSQYVHHYMRGYFDGDGTITNCGLSINRKILQGSFSILGTQSFIENYQKILINKAKLTKTKIYKHKSVYKLVYIGNNNIKKIYQYLYNSSNIYLDRKKDKFMLYTATEALKLPKGALTIT
jgi:hypothetical protein